MSTIKTDLRTAATDEQGNLKLSGTRAFAGVFSMGLILGSQDPHSKRFPTDEKGLQNTKEQLESMAFECLSGLAGIGALISTANPEYLTKNDLERIGLAINNLALLGIEAQGHVESIEIDLCRRRQNDELGTLIATALADGRLLFSQKAWAESVGKSNFAALIDYLEAQAPAHKTEGR